MSCLFIPLLYNMSGSSLGPGNIRRGSSHFKHVLIRVAEGATLPPVMSILDNGTLAVSVALNPVI